MTTMHHNAIATLNAIASAPQPAYVGPVSAVCIGHRYGQSGAVAGCGRLLAMTSFPTSPRSVGIVRRLTECRKCRDARTSAQRDNGSPVATGANATVPRHTVTPVPDIPAWAVTLNRFARIVSSNDDAIRSVVERNTGQPFGVFAAHVTGVRPAGVPFARPFARPFAPVG